MGRATKQNWDFETSRGNQSVPGDTPRRGEMQADALAFRQGEVATLRGGFNRAGMGQEARGPGAGEELRETYSPSAPELSRGTLTSKNPTSSLQRRSQE